MIYDCTEYPRLTPPANSTGSQFWGSECSGYYKCVKDIFLDVYQATELVVDSHIDRFPQQTCSYECCSSSKESFVSFNSRFIAKIYNNLYIDGAGWLYNRGSNVFDVSRLPRPLALDNCTSSRECINGIIKHDKLKISINYKDRNSNCGSNKITDMFLKNLGYLPPINGCRVEMLYDFFNNTPTRLVAFLDVNSNNIQYRNFDYYNTNDISQDFKIRENDEYDNNYPKITLEEYRGPFDENKLKRLIFASSQCPNNSLFEFRREVEGGLDEFVKILGLAVEYVFEIRNGKLYMKPILYSGIYNNLNRTDDVFSNEEILISEISDFYKEVTFMPDNSAGRSNNTNCRVKVSLYG